MLPRRPHAFDAAFIPEISQSDAPATQGEKTRVDHHCQICPNCSQQLSGHHCKLVCTRCGYYLSCADYF
jgi:ribosomal protein S27AE